MNLREGTRRLALAVGVVGAILCGVLSYALLQSDLSERVDHRKFEKLANSAVALHARKECFGPSEDAPWEKYRTMPANPRTPPKMLPKDFFNSPHCYTPNDDQSEIDYTPSKSNGAGIKTLHFENRELESIDMEAGQTLYPTPAPGAWSYLLIVILPVLGFFIPWCAIRAIGWVVAGYAQPLN